MKKKIAVIASSRATYGYKRKLIGLIHDSPKLELQLIVTGMHLLKEYGYSVEEIEADGYPIAARVDMMVGGDTPSTWARSIGVEIQGLAQAFDMLKPELTLVTGDRAEMLAGAVTAAYMAMPIAHIQAGDVSGHVDGSARHAITKLSHIHLAACEDSARRVERMGEERWRIHNVGAPQLDAIVHDKKLPRNVLNEKLGIDLGRPTIMLIQHPVMAEQERTYDQLNETMEALVALKLQCMVIYPNVDSSGLEAIRAIQEYESLPFIHVYRNIEREVFISLLGEVKALVGNSSCGILESPSFKLPAINIGNRQRGRMQAENVINAGHDQAEIKTAISKALNDTDFLKRVESCVNPYGDGNSTERILKILEDLEINEKLLDKRITY